MSVWSRASCGLHHLLILVCGFQDRTYLSWFARACDAWLQVLVVWTQQRPISFFAMLCGCYPSCACRSHQVFSPMVQFSTLLLLESPQRQLSPPFFWTIEMSRKKVPMTRFRLLIRHFTWQSHVPLTKLMHVWTGFWLRAVVYRL